LTFTTKSRIIRGSQNFSCRSFYCGAKKRAKQAEVSRQHNVADRSKLRTYIKKVLVAIETKNHQAAMEAFKVAQPILDKMAVKGIIHKNKAARHKSRLNAKIKALAV
jgi:small subunit ribosomal protein S20